MNYENFTTDELGDTYSDFFKETYGFRPSIDYSSREVVIAALEDLNQYHKILRSDVIGRNMLRAEGWIIGTESDGYPTAEEDGFTEKPEESEDDVCQESFDFPVDRYEEFQYMEDAM